MTRRPARDAEPSTPARLLLAAAEMLFPGYFALVMATGVVSIAAELLGFPLFAALLLGINSVAYVVLWALTLLRLVRYPRHLAADLADHQRAPGFFTLVAGTCVLGTQAEIVGGAHGLASALWYAGIVLWVGVMYAFFTAVIARDDKPSLAGGINGAWLIAAVATQSIVVLGTTVAASPGPAGQLLCLSMFMVGGMLYLAIIPLIFYRLTFMPLATQDFAPPYWINMGALAITTLAGALLILNAGRWTVIQDYVPFVKGFTLFCWAAATWWIPLLTALMAWRHLVRRDRLVYEPQIWSLVFPLGMYTSCTYELARALDLPLLAVIPEHFVYVAAAAWLAAFAGLLARLTRAARSCFWTSEVAAGS